MVRQGTERKGREGNVRTWGRNRYVWKMKDDSCKVQTDMGTILSTTDSWEWSAWSQAATDIHDGSSILNSQPSVSS